MKSAVWRGLAGNDLGGQLQGRNGLLTDGVIYAQPCDEALIARNRGANKAFRRKGESDLAAKSSGPSRKVDFARLKLHMRAMKIADAEILIVPGYTNSGPDHWQTRWQGKLSTARRVEQAEWSKPVREEWVGRLVDEVNRATKPVVLVGHSLGAAVCVLAAAEVGNKVRGAFLVAPPDTSNPAIRPRHLMTFGPYPLDPLPFASTVVASRNDPFCAHEVAGDLAASWGSLFLDGGEAGHINAESGHGPWPEGIMVFSRFLQNLKP